MNRKVLVTILAIVSHAAYAQNIKRLINLADVTRIEQTLSADNLQGRGLYSAGIEKAASFVAAEFRKSGLLPVNNTSYFQEFNVMWSKPVSFTASVNGNAIDDHNLFVFSAQQQVHINNATTHQLLTVGPAMDLDSIIHHLQKTNGTYVLNVDTALGRAFMRAKKRLAASTIYSAANIVGILSTGDIESFDINYTQEVTVRPLKNVAGMLQGKSKKDEIVIFSAHYDHLGVGPANAAGDSIFNGANDDASGVTAVIMLAKYFAQKKDNERTLVFVAFTAEESGGFGSQYFSQQVDPAAVAAMFNIELIGTQSRWGTNSAFITGYELTDAGTILQQQLQGTPFIFHPDPYPAERLFYRSDNATLARLGVPAHTISTSKMDNEPYYHTQDDELTTLDLRNMTQIIRAIATSSATVVSGKDTPTRVDAKAILAVLNPAP